MTVGWRCEERGTSRSEPMFPETCPHPNPTFHPHVSPRRPAPSCSPCARSMSSPLMKEPAMLISCTMRVMTAVGRVSQYL